MSKLLLQINVIANSGSTGKIAEGIGQAAMDRGWRSVIAYGRWANPSQSELLHIGSDFDNMEHALESRILDNHGLASRRATRRFIDHIKDLKPDVIHLHNLHGYYINYQILFEYLNTTNIPVVWTLHDCWSFTGHCSHFVTAGCDKWKKECYACPLKRDYPKAFIDHSTRNYELKKSLFASNKNLHIVAVSDWLADLVRQSFFKGNDIRTIKNGVDLTMYKPLESERHGKKRILGVSTVWTENKGLLDFYRLRENLEQDKYEIVLVGLTKQQIATLPRGIIGIERTESVQELVRLYSLSDVLVNPTYADTFPTINLEALACGLSVVTYRTGGSPETVDMATGIVVEQGEINALSKAVTEICSRDRDDLRRFCRIRAEKEFDKDRCFKNYFALYKEFIGG